MIRHLGEDRYPREPATGSQPPLGIESEQCHRLRVPKLDQEIWPGCTTGPSMHIIQAAPCLLRLPEELNLLVPIPVGDWKLWPGRAEKPQATLKKN